MEGFAFIFKKCCHASVLVGINAVNSSLQEGF